MARRARPSLAGLLALAALAAVAGCATPVGVDLVGSDAVRAALEAGALDGRVPSATSRAVLERHDLVAAWVEDAPAALERLLDAAPADGRRDALFALAELHLLVALDGGGPEDGRHALAAAAFAGEFLLAPSPGAPPDPWDAAFQAARDVQARALLEAFRAAPGSPEVRFAAAARPLPRGRLALTVDAAAIGSGSAGAPHPPLFAADEYAVRGLRARARRAGVGLPLIVRPPPIGDDAARRLLHGGRFAYPATAVLEVEGGIAALASGSARAAVTLLPAEDADRVRLGGRDVPLAADFTAPVAHALEEARVWSFEVGGFLSGDPAVVPPGLALLAPHRPGRIPIVLVHGTASSPARWAELVNVLHGEEALRDRFEFWLFMYSTGNPIPYSAHLLREALAQAALAYDPVGADPALRRMVLVGHSQGGLLCRLVSSGSGDFVGALLDGRRLEDLDLPADQRALLRSCLVFGPAPTVGRAVFLATPHGGSFLAEGLLGGLGSALAAVGGQAAGLATLTFRTRTGEVLFPEGLEVPTAVDNMAPGSRFLAALAQMPPGPGVTFHSIVAVDGEGDPAALDDGVVAYRSAHLPGVASELVVRSGHSCQAHPLVIEELRRILLAHVAPVARGP